MSIRQLKYQPRIFNLANAYSKNDGTLKAAALYAVDKDGNIVKNEVGIFILNPTSITEEQLKMIKDHLNLVLTKKTNNSLTYSTGTIPLSIPTVPYTITCATDVGSTGSLLGSPPLDSSKTTLRC